MSSKYKTQNFFPVEDYDTYITKSRRVKYTGTIWKLYKPLSDDTLYAQILHNPGDIQVHTFS